MFFVKKKEKASATVWDQQFVFFNNNRALWHKGKRLIRLWIHKQFLLGDQLIVGFSW